MYVAEITFHLPARTLEQAAQNALENAVYRLLAAWEHGGRMELSEPSMVQLPDRCVIYAYIPEPHTLDAALDRTPVKNALQELQALGIAAPDARVLGTAFAVEPNCHCDKHSSYILYTTLFSRVSPLHCGDCFQPVPLYLIPPISNDSYQELLDWQTAYKACDTLYIQSRALEQEAIYEMAWLKSKLTKRGRKFCRMIEKSTGIPTYYYLHHFPWQKADQEERRCPDCDSAWRLPRPWHNLFYYKCDSSRLLSSRAFA